MTLDELLNSNNVNGKIYRCDIRRFFGWNLTSDKVEELHKAMTEIKEKLNGISDRT